MEMDGVPAAAKEVCAVSTMVFVLAPSRMVRYSARYVGASRVILDRNSTND